MKIALFSDVHANLPALDAFFADLEKKQPDAVYCLGDLVGYNYWPNEVINEVRKRKIPTIAGNYDFGIGRASNDCGCAYKSDQEKANGAVSISVTNELVNKDERQYLRTLPAHIKLEFQLNADKLNLLLVHGSPRKINEYLFEDREENSLYRIMAQADADILCFGHTHKPFHKALVGENGVTPHVRHAINTGSVGKPKDGDPRGGYVLLTIHENSSITDANSIDVEFVRFEYDVEKAADGVLKAGLPAAYAESLRTGR